MPPDMLVAFCVLPLLVLFTIFVVRMSRGIDIEYCGGPDDGHRTVSLTKEEIIETYSDDYSTVHRYTITNEYTHDAFLKYRYIGSQKVDTVFSVRNK